MTVMLSRLREEQSGQALVLVAVFILGLVAVAGLVTDGGMVFVQRRDLQNAADAAAAAGASQLDDATYRASGGETAVLDEAAAYGAAIRYLEGEANLDYAVAVSPDRVHVSVSRRAATGFLRVLGIDGVEISASASAAPRYGIVSAGP